MCRLGLVADALTHADVAPVSSVHGDMTWNPAAQRWEGNEGVLREFDKALATSTRPALITQLSAGFSPHRARGLEPSLPDSTDASTNVGIEALRRLGSNVSSTPLVAKNVKVVGSMVFDPTSMCWRSLDAEDDLELDLAFEGSDWADDEGEEPAAERGERERMLKSRASFVRSDNGGTEVDVDALGFQALRDECFAAEMRHAQETRGWTRFEREGEEIEMREQLWDIRKVSLLEYAIIA